MSPRGNGLELSSTGFVVLGALVTRSFGGFDARPFPPFPFLALLPFPPLAFFPPFAFFPMTIIFVAPPKRCEGPPSNDVTLENKIIYARDRGERNAAFAALFPPRPYLLCDYREFEKTGVIRVLELEPGCSAPGGE